MAAGQSNGTGVEERSDEPFLLGGQDKNGIMLCFCRERIENAGIERMASKPVIHVPVNPGAPGLADQAGHIVRRAAPLLDDAGTALGKFARYGLVIDAIMNQAHEKNGLITRFDKGSEFQEPAKICRGRFRPLPVGPEPGTGAPRRCSCFLRTVAEYAVEVDGENILCLIPVLHEIAGREACAFAVGTRLRAM